VLLLGVNTDIVITLFKYRVNFRHLTLMIETFELLIKKAVRNLICYS